MKLAQSKVTSQGQISVPAEVRKKLGIGPGSVLEWNEEGEQVSVRKVGKYTFHDIHRVLFPDGPPPYRTDAELKNGIADYIREQHARGRY